MTNLSHLDDYDTKILQALQADGRLSNAELAEQVSLSPSQCSRRRQSLEAEQVISGYHASISREKTGFALINFISVTLSRHNKNNATQFAKLINKLPEVLEAHALTGEMDYILKVVTTDLAGLSKLVNDQLLQHESVQNVKTAVVLDTIKETTALPLSKQS
jgi:DNA-binding Lrp family transcriptional regulator